MKIHGNQLLVNGQKGRKRVSATGLRAGLSVFLAAQSVVVSAAAKEPTATAACDVKGGRHAVVAAIDERLELTLADGRVLRLAGLEAAGPSPNDEALGLRARDWLSAWLLNRDIIYETLDPKADRWGRYAALVVAMPLSGEAELASAAESLAGQGFARVVPDQSKNPCQRRLLQAEAAARAARHGLWNDPYYDIIEAGDAAAFEEHAGSVILAEGRLTDVRDASARTTLFFGPRRRNHLAVTILQRNVKIFEAAGLHFHDLIGQTLRVRGLLETRFGPEIEVANPSEVELVADGPSETVKPMQKAPAMTRP